MRRRAPLAALPVLVAVVLGVAACGSEQVDLASSNPDRRGADLFAQRCSGCHTLSAAGAQGSAASVRDKQRTNGPNFNQRREDAKSVLYAIRNGGFSGAIMPQNIVTGNDAEAVASFVGKYSGASAPESIAP